MTSSNPPQRGEVWLVNFVGGAALRRPEPVEGSLSKGASLQREFYVGTRDPEN
jgi:hypothetical protein